jgi:ATP-dependent Clp protease protease subunit
MARNEVKKIDLHNIDLFHDANLHVPSRTVYFGGSPHTLDEVDSISVAEVIKNLHLLEHLEPGRPITIHLNSCGGSWYDGIIIYDCIKALKSPVTIIGMGKCFSMGSIILQAGDARVLMPHTHIMCHAGEDCAIGHPSDVQAWAKNSKKIMDEMCQIYYEQMVKKNPKITIEKIKKMFDHDAIFNAEEAVALGLADIIMDYVTKE